jgi:hypothetical protein
LGGGDHLNQQKLGVVAYTYHLSFVRSIKRRITVQASLGIKARFY